TIALILATSIGEVLTNSFPFSLKNGLRNAVSSILESSPPQETKVKGRDCALDGRGIPVTAMATPSAVLPSMNCLRLNIIASCLAVLPAMRLRVGQDAKALRPPTHFDGLAGRGGAIRKAAQPQPLSRVQPHSYGLQLAEIDGLLD